MIRCKRRIRCAARQCDFRSLGVNDEFSFGIAAQDAAHIANVMQQTGGNQVAIVLSFYSLMHHHSMQNVASDLGDLQGVFVVVVKRVAPGQTFDDAPRQRAYAFRPIVACRTKNLAKIPGEEIAELVCRDGRYRFHWRSPNDRGSFRSPCSVDAHASNELLEPAPTAVADIYVNRAGPSQMYFVYFAAFPRQSVGTGEWHFSAHRLA